MDPSNAPMQIVDPTHDDCSFVNGPDEIGVSFEVNCCKAELVHPFALPCAKTIKFAEINQLN